MEPEAARLPEAVAVALWEHDREREAEAIAEAVALCVSEIEAEKVTVGGRVADTVADAELLPDPERVVVAVRLAEALRLPDGVAERDRDKVPELPVELLVVVRDGVAVLGWLRLGEGVRLRDGVLRVAVGVQLRHLEPEGVAVVVGRAVQVVERLALEEREGLQTSDAVGERLREVEGEFVGHRLAEAVQDREALLEAEAEGVRVRECDVLPDAEALPLMVAVGARDALLERVGLSESVEAVALALREREAVRVAVRVAVTVVAVREQEREQVAEGVAEAEAERVAVRVPEALQEAELGDWVLVGVRLPVGDAVQVGTRDSVSEPLPDGRVLLWEDEPEAVAVGVTARLQVLVRLPDREGVEVRVEAVVVWVEVSVEGDADGVGLREGETDADGVAERVAVDCEGVLLPVEVQDSELGDAEMEAESVQEDTECVVVGVGLMLVLGLRERLSVRDRERELAVADAVCVLQVAEGRD